jgi:hypothetical protein
MKDLEPLHRSISQEEAAVVGWLIEHGEPEAREYADNLQSLTVMARCNCGCPTVYFEVEGDPVSRRGERIISDHLGIVDGQEVGVMLFALGRQLSSLEVYSLAGSDKPFKLPKISDLYAYEDSSKR